MTLNERGRFTTVMIGVILTFAALYCIACWIIS
jgi:hypothetical protein